MQLIKQKQSIKRILCFALLLIPCLFLFTACFGSDPNSISSSTAFSRTGIPRLNAGVVQSYQVNKDGSSRMVISGLSKSDIDDYKQKLVDRDGFITDLNTTSDPNVWYRQNYIDNNPGDTIKITQQIALTNYTITIDFKSYFSQELEITSAKVQQILEGLNTSIYLKQTQKVMGTEIFPREEYPSNLVNYVNVITEYGATENTFYRCITHEVHLHNETVLNYKYKVAQETTTDAETGEITAGNTVYFFLSVPSYEQGGQTLVTAEESYATRTVAESSALIGETINISNLLKMVYPDDIGAMMNNYLGAGQSIVNEKVKDTEIFTVNGNQITYCFENNNLNGIISQNTIKDINISKDIPLTLTEINTENKTSTSSGRIAQYFNNYSHLNVFSGEKAN